MPENGILCGLFGVCGSGRSGLLEYQEQAHLEAALGGDAVQAVLVKAEALAGGQLVVPAFAADDGGAFQCGEDAAVGGAGTGRTCCRVKIGNVIHCPPWVGFHPQYARTSVERLWL